LGSRIKAKTKTGLFSEKSAEFFLIGAINNGRRAPTQGQSYYECKRGGIKIGMIEEIFSQ
jgi:hypothetical protein